MSIPGWDDKLQKQLLEEVRKVGDFQLEEFGNLDPEQVDEKGTRDLVTWVDRESEDRLARVLEEILPEAALRGEEGRQRKGRGELCWLVDPLDGTSNYSYGHPFFAISVALLKGRRPVLGIIHAPALRETFHALEAEGAYLGDRPLKVSPRKDPANMLFATGFAETRQVHAEVNLRNMDRMLHASRGVRRAGSAALDLAYVAAGRFDAFWEMGLQAWDIAAGICLVRSAGGRVSDLQGREDLVYGQSILASNGLVHEWMLGELELDPRFRGGS